MATVNIKAFRHHLKDDGTINLKIVLYHKGSRVYMPTPFFAVPKQLKKDYTVKDPVLLSQITDMLSELRGKINSLGTSINNISVRHLADILSGIRNTDPTTIDFVSFGLDYVDKLCREGRKNTSVSFKGLIYALQEFVGHEYLYVSDINSYFLMKFEAYLRSERTIVRKKGGGTMTIKTQVGDSGAYLYMSNFQMLYRMISDHYNDYDTGDIIIKSDPFRKYKIPKRKETQKRNLDVDTIKKIFNYAPKLKVDMFARDMFIFSFCMCGMNAIDIMTNIEEIAEMPERIRYSRRKTARARKDRAVISVRLVDLAKKAIEPWIKEVRETSSDRYLNKSLSTGLNRIGEELRIGRLTLYHARHSFATIARNVCRFSKDDVAAALNHSDPTRSITDIYIAKDWTIVDEVQSGVLSLLK